MVTPPVPEHLLALHVIRACGENENAEEARLLCELLWDLSSGVACAASPRA